MKRIAVVTVVFGILLCSSGCGGGSSASGPKNVLLISIDALRADHLGSWGYERDTSPFLDQLASQGARYPLAFVNTHGTPPSHSTMLSSLYQETHRVGLRDRPDQEPDLRLPEGVVTLQDILSSNGWKTVAVTGGGYMGEEFGFARGFDVFSDRPRSIETGAEALLDSLRLVLPDERPVFALFHTYQVHSPYESPDRYDGLFGSDSCSIEPIAENLAPIQAHASDHLSPGDFQCLAALYDRGIRHTDDVLRSLFKNLEELGFLDHALVIITSDHGEEFGDHGGLLHRGSLFNELLHVPLIVWDTSAEGGTVDSRLASTIDIPPTILAWAGIEEPGQMEGRSLLTAAEGEGSQKVFSQYGSQIYSLRSRQWKLIVGGEWARPMLFDVARDPGEKHNVARDYPEVVTSLIDELTMWRENRPRLDLTTQAPADINPHTQKQLEALGYLSK